MIIDETIHEVEVKRKVGKLPGSWAAYCTVPSGRPMGYNEPFPDPYKIPVGLVTAESICNAAMDIIGE